MPHLMLHNNIVVRYLDQNDGTQGPGLEWIELTDSEAANISMGDVYYPSNGHIIESKYIDVGGDVQPVVVSDEERIASVRSARNQALDDSDWTQFADSPLTDAKKAEWQTYRQQLRDLPTSNTNPFDIDFPAEPS